MAVDVTRTIDELCALPVDDRLKVVTAVWDSLPEESAAPVSPEQRAGVESAIGCLRSKSRACTHLESSA